MKSSLDLQTRRMLKAAKLYCTKCRVAILKVLVQADRPFSQNQIARRLGKDRLNKVTVYRVLERLCEAGLVHKASVEKRAVHFELANRCSATQCHPHFVCTNCGVTNCLEGTSIPMVKVLDRGFVIHRQQVRLEGLCPQCA